MRQVPAIAGALPARLQVLSELQEPVSSYRDALWRLFEYQRETGIDYQKTPMPWAIQLVADIFWVEPRKVRADLIKMAQVS
ncbi:hypothetical protein M3484_21790 [Pseudomonas sp. GX19020]|uniref:hypothetical protein n=1 Tax=Pseudomonas sp. GX19020 TaxID=2942277 RepID=UPI0020185184|nr:hypothetical protein [Pseudomonas sp. GX19020]MCL4069194.1 hypothetical protein [Pseudomonas sp. GX19020]